MVMFKTFSEIYLFTARFYFSKINFIIMTIYVAVREIILERSVQFFTRVKNLL